MAVGYSIQVSGQRIFSEKLKKRKEALVQAVQRGLIKAGFIIQAESQRNTPVDFGNLKASAFTVWEGFTPPAPRFVDGEKGPSGEKVNADDLARDHQVAVERGEGQTKGVRGPAVLVGHSAYYAIYVHENLNAHHTVGFAKFLETAVMSQQDRITRAIVEEVIK